MACDLAIRSWKWQKTTGLSKARQYRDKIYGKHWPGRKTKYLSPREMNIIRAPTLLGTTGTGKPVSPLRPLAEPVDQTWGRSPYAGVSPRLDSLLQWRWGTGGHLWLLPKDTRNFSLGILVPMNTIFIGNMCPGTTSVPAWVSTFFFSTFIIKCAKLGIILVSFEHITRRKVTFSSFQITKMQGKD